jgi:hypothetical protein
MSTLNLGFSNKDTMGKHLRAQSGIYRSDPSAIRVEEEPALKTYMDFFIQNGLKADNIGFADFHLRNGLPYRGLYAAEKVLPGQPIIQVPRKLVMTTTDAYFSDLKETFDKNIEYFIPANTWAWEYRMLIVYILNEYSKGEKSFWSAMIGNMPRDYDVIADWTDEEIEALEDEDFIREVKATKEDYHIHIKDIIEFVNKHPDVFDVSVFTAENISWIWIQLISRKYGWMRNTKYVSCVPFGEFFNHNCTRLQYDSIFNEKDLANADNCKPMTEEHFKDQATTEGSDGCDGPLLENEDFITENDVPQIDGIASASNTEVETKANSILATLSTLINSRNGFELFFLNKISTDIQDIVSNAQANKITPEEAIKSLETAQVTLAKYTADLNRYNTEVRVQKNNTPDFTEADQIKYKTGNKLIKEHPFKGMTKETIDDNFNMFEIRLSEADQFEAGSQILLLYGKLSNRYMLLEYGCAIENNKYDYYLLKLPFLEELNQNKWMMNELQKVNHLKEMKFKLGWTHLNTSLLNFLKGSAFDAKKHSYDALIKPTDLSLELDAIRQAINLIKIEQKGFSASLEEHEALLEDKSLSYHQYFIVTYKLERQRILRQNLQSLQALAVIIERIQKGENLNDACRRVEDIETQDEFKRNRYFLRKYLAQLHN